MPANSFHIFGIALAITQLLPLWMPSWASLFWPFKPFLYDANTKGLLLILPFFIALRCLILNPSLRTKTLMIGLLVLYGYLIYHSHSRATILGLSAGLSLIGISTLFGVVTLRNHLKKTTKRLNLPALISLLFFVCVLVGLLSLHFMDRLSH